MRRRRRSRRRSVRWLLWLPVLAGVLILGWLQAERVAFRRLRHWLDGAGLRDWYIGSVSWHLPSGLTLTDVQLEGAHGVSVSSPRLHIDLGWPSSQGVRIRTLSLDEPTLVLEREAPEPSIRFFDHSDSTSTASVAELPLVIDSIVVTGARVDWIDHTRTPVFRLRLQDITAVAGPWTSALNPPPVAVAFQAQMAQELERPASARCTGWVAAPQRALDLDCHVENVLVAAFEPYYQGEVEFRAYDATLALGLRAVAVDNRLNAVAKLSLGNLSQADLSFLGRTIVDIKRLAGSDERVMTGDMVATGQLDRPSTWQVRLVPGNAVVQRLLEAILEHGIHAVPIRLGEETVHVGFGAPPEAPSISGPIPRADAAAPLLPAVVAPAPTPSESPLPSEILP